MDTITIPEPKAEHPEATVSGAASEVVGTVVMEVAVTAFLGALLDGLF